MGKKPFRRLSAEEGVSVEVAHEHFAYEPLEITIIDPVFEACHNGKLSRVGIIVGRFICYFCSINIQKISNFVQKCEQ